MQLVGLCICGALRPLCRVQGHDAGEFGKHTQTVQACIALDVCAGEVRCGVVKALGMLSEPLGSLRLLAVS